MTELKKFHPIVEELVDMIKENHWKGAFEKSISLASAQNVPLLEFVTNLDQYLHWINEFLFWIPTEISSGQNVNDHLCAFYFIADQEPLLKLQNKVVPHDRASILTPFSNWLVDYANALGEFLDTPESLSASSEKSFYDAPAYNMHEYSKPHGGWISSNCSYFRSFHYCDACRFHIWWSMGN